MSDILQCLAGPPRCTCASLPPPNTTWFLRRHRRLEGTGKSYHLSNHWSEELSCGIYISAYTRMMDLSVKSSNASHEIAKTEWVMFCLATMGSSVSHLLLHRWMMLHRLRANSSISGHDRGSFSEHLRAFGTLPVISLQITSNAKIIFCLLKHRSSL